MVLEGLGSVNLSQLFIHHPPENPASFIEKAQLDLWQPWTGLVHWLEPPLFLPW